ncbi:RDD family protein [Paucibacter sp. DJ2R-2]|uniref:RDD family protein n=1 Tax=Paucibacter sp. DJ2R-2 TaxID=2893558 RepID=UPI0021E3AD72|nr:RDD family protein [Paucibacter sp. DJ2R-2]MCV2439856.1 RDD family protein [Paucibacter sp. DJ2R-2]
MSTPATFSQRFAASLIDFAVFLPVLAAQALVFKHSKAVATALVIPLSFCFLAYVIYCHGRYGQTIGKRVMRIRVLQLSGERLAWSNAWARSSVDIGLTTLSTLSFFIALLHVPDSLYYAASYIEQINNLQAYEPSWASWSATATQVWALGELVTMLFNKHRRALHDFIGGTVVVSERTTFSPSALSDA